MAASPKFFKSTTPVIVLLEKRSGREMGRRWIHLGLRVSPARLHHGYPHGGVVWQRRRWFGDGISEIESEREGAVRPSSFITSS